MCAFRCAYCRYYQCHRHRLNDDNIIRTEFCDRESFKELRTSVKLTKQQVGTIINSNKVLQSCKLTAQLLMLNTILIALLLCEATSHINSVWLATPANLTEQSISSDHNAVRTNSAPQIKTIQYWQPAPAPTFASLTPAGSSHLLSTASSSLKPAIVDSGDPIVQQQPPQRRSETVAQDPFRVLDIDNNPTDDPSGGNRQQQPDPSDINQSHVVNVSNSQVQFDEEQQQFQQQQQINNNNNNNNDRNRGIVYGSGHNGSVLNDDYDTNFDNQRTRYSLHNSTNNNDNYDGSSKNLTQSNYDNGNSQPIKSSHHQYGVLYNNSNNSHYVVSNSNSLDPMDDGTYDVTNEAAFGSSASSSQSGDQNDLKRKQPADSDSNKVNINFDHTIRPIQGSSWLPTQRQHDSSSRLSNQSSVLYFLSEPSPRPINHYEPASSQPTTPSTPAATTALDIQRIKFSSNDQWRRPQVHQGMHHLAASEMDRQTAPTTTLATTVADITQPTTVDAYSPTTAASLEPLPPAPSYLHTNRSILLLNNNQQQPILVSGDNQLPWQQQQPRPQFSAANRPYYRIRVPAYHRWNPTGGPISVAHPLAYQAPVDRSIGRQKLANSAGQLSAKEWPLVATDNQRHKRPVPSVYQRPSNIIFEQQQQHQRQQYPSEQTLSINTINKLNSQRRGLKPATFVERVKSVPQPNKLLLSNGNRKLSLFGSLGNRFNNWGGSLNDYSSQDQSHIQATLESAFFDGLPSSYDQWMRPPLATTNYNRRRRPSNVMVGSANRYRPMGSSHRPSYVNPYAYAMLNTAGTGNFYGDDTNRHPVSTGVGGSSSSSSSSSSGVGSSHLSPMPQVTFYAPATTISHPQVAQAAQNSLDRLYGIGYATAAQQQLPTITFAPNTGAWATHTPLSHTSVLLQPAQAMTPQVRRRRRPMSAPSAATMAVVVDSNSPQQVSAPSQLVPHVGRAASSAASRPGFIPVVALQVTRTSPAPTNLRQPVQDQSIEQQQQQQQHQQVNSKNEADRTRNELDAYLDAKTGSGSSSATSNRGGEYNSLASSVSMAGPQTSSNSNGNNVIGNGASPSTRSTEHMTTIKSALFGYLPQQLAADAPNIQQALSVLSQLSQNGPPTLAQSPSIHQQQHVASQASDFTHQLAGLSHLDASSAASSDHLQQPSLALQLQANNYAQNEIVHPFGSSQLLMPPAADQTNQQRAAAAASHLFFYPPAASQQHRFQASQVHHLQDPLRFSTTGWLAGQQAAAAAVAGEQQANMLAAAGSELSPFIPAMVFANTALQMDASGSNSINEDTVATSTASSSSSDSNNNNNNDDDNDEQSTEQSVLQNLINSATGGGGGGGSTSTKGVNNKKRSSDFFASAGQLLLSALPLLLVPSLGFMFSGSNAHADAARYHAPNPLGPEPVHPVLQAVAAGSSKGSLQSTGYLSDGYVMNAQPAPQMFTPIPPTAAASDNNYSEGSQIYQDQGQRNVSSAQQMNNSSQQVATANLFVSGPTGMTLSSTTTTKRPMVTTNPVMRMAASSIVGSISPHYGSSYNHPSNKHLYKPSTSTTPHPNLSATRSGAAQTNISSPVFHTLIDEQPINYSQPNNIAATKTSRRPISTIIITTMPPEVNNTESNMANTPMVITDDDYLARFNATNSSTASDGSITIKQPTILLVTHEDDISNGTDYNQVVRRREDLHHQVNATQKNSSSIWNLKPNQQVMAIDGNYSTLVPIVDGKKQLHKNHYEYGYEGADFDAQFASLPTIRNNHSNSSSRIGGSIKPSSSMANKPQLSYLTTPLPILKHIRDKNRYQYTEVSNDSRDYGVSFDQSLPPYRAHMVNQQQQQPTRWPQSVDIFTLNPLPQSTQKPAKVNESSTGASSSSENTSTRLYPMSTWPPMRRRTVSLVTANGNKTVPDASSRYSANYNAPDINNSSSRSDDGMSIIDDLVSEIVDSSRSRSAARRRSKRSIVEQQGKNRPAKTSRRPNRRRNLVRRVIRIRPKGEHVVKKSNKLGQLAAAETNAKVAIREITTPAKNKNNKVISNRNLIKGPIISPRMDNDGNHYASDDPLQVNNIDTLKEDDSRSKSSHLITAMIEHLDDNNPDSNLLDGPMSGSGAIRNASDWEMREQLLRKKMMLDKIATHSYALPSDEVANKSYYTYRPDSDQLDLGLGGRGRFLGADRNRPNGTSAMHLGNHRYADDEQDIYDSNQRKNSLELNDDAKRALAKFGKLLMQETLQVDGNQRSNLSSGNDNSLDTSKQHRHQVSARLIKLDRDNYPPTRSNAGGTVAATERYYSHSVTRAPEALRPEPWLDSRYNASDDYFMDQRRRNYRPQVNASDQWPWRATDERQQYSPPNSHYSYNNNNDPLTDRNNEYQSGANQDSPINRYNNFLASTVNADNASSLHNYPFSNTSSLQNYPFSNTSSSASSIPSRSMTSRGGGSDSSSPDGPPVDSRYPMYNSSRSLSYATGNNNWPSPGEPNRYEAINRPPAGHYSSDPYRSSGAVNPYRPEDHTNYRPYSQQDHYQPSPDTPLYSNRRPYPVDSTAPPHDPLHHHHHNQYPPPAPPPPPYHPHQRTAYGEDVPFEPARDRVRSTYQPYLAPPLQAREPSAHYAVGGQYAASIPVRRPAMRPPPLDSGGVPNPYSQSTGVSQPFGPTSQAGDGGAVKDYLERAQFSDSDRDKLMASYLTCDGLLNDNDHCLERLACEFSDPKNIEKANKLDRAVSSILLGHILINTYIPNQFKLRLKSASMFGYTQSGKCSRYICSKLVEQQQQQQATNNNEQNINNSSNNNNSNSNFNDDK